MSEKKLCHTADIQMSSPRFKCLFRSLDRVKVFPQVVHSNSFSPEWVNWCCFKLPEVEKVLSHCKHPYGFTPLCVILCLVRFRNVVKSLPHCLQVRSMLDGGWGRTGGLGSGFKWRGSFMLTMLGNKSERNGNVCLNLEKVFYCFNFH